MNNLPNNTKVTNKQLFPVILPVIWLFATTAFVMFLSMYLLLDTQQSQSNMYKYAVFSAKPKVLGYATQSVTTEDARAERIDKIFEKYKCPIQG